MNHENPLEVQQEPLQFIYNETVKHLDLSERKLVSIKDPRKGLITAWNLRQFLTHVDIPINKIRYINLSRCGLLDVDLIILTDEIINHFSSIEYINLSENWFKGSRALTAVGPSLLNDLQACDALKKLLSWGIHVDVSGTIFEGLPHPYGGFLHINS